MKSIRFYVVACVCFFIAFSHSHAEQTPTQIAAHIFLGQAYPSGNIYLKPFPLPSELQSEDDYLKSFSWLSSVNYHALSSTHPYANKIREGYFLSVMHDGEHEIEGATQLESAHIPGLESMNDTHEGCTKELYKSRNPRFEYLGDDFFSQVLFNCNPNAGTPIYKK